MQPPVKAALQQLLLGGYPVQFLPPSDPPTQDETSLRTIPAAWLEQLLQPPERCCNLPIQIENAIIHGPLNLRGASFKSHVIFLNCEFDSDVLCNFARFYRSLVLDNSTFSGTVSLRAAQIDGDFRIGSCTFQTTAQFTDLHVKQLLVASGAQFAEASFERVRVEKSAFFRVREEKNTLRGARFDGTARFLDAHIEGNAEFDGVYFGGVADFTRMSVGGDAFFRLATRNDDLTEITTGVFTAKFEKTATFDKMKIAGDAVFSGAEFDSNVTFTGTQIGHNLTFGPAFFKGTALQTRFRDSVDFFRLHVCGTAWFAGIDFGGPVNFERALIDGAGVFRLLEEKGTVVATRFRQSVKFLDAEMHGADFQGATFEKTANFIRFVVHSNAKFAGWWTQDKKHLYVTHFMGGVTFEDAKIEGTLEFHTLECDSDASFADAEFGLLHFAIPGLPSTQANFKKTLNLRGMVYERISADWMTLHKTMDYDRQPYVQLEKSYRAAGDDREAAKIYLARKRRESHEMRRGFQRNDKKAVLPWIGDCVRLIPDFVVDSIQRYLLRYGVRPLRLLVLSLFFLLFGWFTFSRPGAIVPKNSPDSSTPVSVSTWQAFRISLRLFVPGIDIPSGENIAPSASACSPLPFLTFEAYGTIHRIAGIVLLPLGIAALAGLLIPSRDRNATE